MARIGIVPDAQIFTVAYHRRVQYACLAKLRARKENKGERVSIHLKTETSEPLRLIIGILGIFLLAGGIVSLSQMGLCGVAQRTLDADNIIFNYEQFFDVSERFKAKVIDIGTHNELVATAKAEGDRDELRRLRMELAALKSSCRALASEYNADSQKLNRSIFKSNNLPHTLPLADCE